MGEPLSVAGSAVGIISLGIQVCQGLVQYADAIRGHQLDVDDGMDEVRSLLAIFKSLEQTITRIETDSPKNAKSLVEHLRQAEVKLRSLEEVLTEVGIPANTSSTIKGKMKETYRVAIYPMKRSKLKGARQNVQSILGILTTALQTVDLDLEVLQSDALKVLQASTTSNASELKAAIEVNSTQLKNLQVTPRQDVSDINKSLILARAEVQAFSTRSASQFDSIGSDVRQSLENTQLLFGMIRDLSLQINAASTTSRSTGSYNQNALLMTTLGSRVPPSSLKQACDLYATDTNLIPESSRSIHKVPQPRRRRRHCKCPPRPNRRDDFLSTASWGAYFDQTTFSEHDVGCPFAKFARRSSTTKAGARFHLQLGGLFSTLVDVSMCLTTGAGGFSLSPSLRYVHILKDRSPVLQLIDECFYSKPASDVSGQENTMVDRLRNMRRQIATCFEQGTASPYDIDPILSTPYWIDLLLSINSVCVRGRYGEEAFRVALDMMQWLADASALEMAKHDAEKWIFFLFGQWQSLLSRLPDNDKNRAVAHDFFGCLLDTIEPSDESVIKLLVGSNLEYIHPLLMSYASPDVSPMAWAILSRSMPELEYQLKLAPASLFERTYGYTTLQLAGTWPQGFTRLIQTDARALLHEPMPNNENLLTSIYHPYSFYKHLDLSTLDILLNAGYTLFPGNSYGTLEDLVTNCTETAVPTIARHLSQRLRRLSETAAKFGITSNHDHSIPDFDTAARWCLALEELGEFIDRSIRVPMNDNMIPTIYHIRNMPLSFFPIFYEHGFIHVNTCDQRGLPPMFIRRGSFHYVHDHFLSQRLLNGDLGTFHNMPWLRQHGFLDQKPHDPLGLGLNIDVTGAHRVAAEMGSSLGLDLDYQQGIDHYLSLAADLLRQFARDFHRDKCVCWCNFDDDGCSPLKLLYKSHAHPTNPYRGIKVWKQDEFQTNSVKRLLFDFDMFGDPTATPTPGVKQQRKREQTTNTQPSTRALEFVRLLTFEALEMTHTCCMLEKLGKNGHYIDAILNCNPSTARDIRQSEEERRNAELLDTLTEEFSNVMQQDYQGKPLLDFIFGYWKTRIENLYAVREDEVQKMQKHVNNVRTGIWPRPLRRLLWPRQ